MTVHSSVIDRPDGHNGHPGLGETPPSGGLNGSSDLVEVARSYATAVLVAEEMSSAAQEAETALYRADIDAITAVNADWEAKINSESTSANEMGFTADLSRCKTGDLAETGRLAQVAKLRYQQCRAVALQTELNAGEATKAAEASEIRLLETARRLATREAMAT